MKTIYTSDNVKKVLNSTQKRFENMYNKKYTISQVIYAFNKLPGKYQDLLLKINKDENDKANLVKVYDYLRRYLLMAKNVSSDINIDIKNINEEEKIVKKNITLEDIESDKGDKWVKPRENDKKTIRVVTFEAEKNKTIKNNESKKILKETNEEKKEAVKVAKIEESKEFEEELVSDSKVDILKEKKEELLIKKEIINERIKKVLVEEYIVERQKIEIEKILDNLELDDDEKFIILLKFDENSVKTNEELSKDLGISTSYIDEVVEKFYNLSIELETKKIYKLEMEL
ncbi:MAG: hypothetical protein J6O56_05850 [Bacilli bacterium]|nr:hypothetical protein [Bacilli bacterium]